MSNSLQQKNRRLLIFLVCGVLLMFGFCYLLIPLYELVCKKEGINGRSVSSGTQYDPHTVIDKTRTIKVFFMTTMHSGLKFKFFPVMRSIDIHPGEKKLVYFYAENESGHEITVQAIPSITPMDGARFLKKTECFCFTQQTFAKDEKAKMPVYFFIEPNISKNIQEMTLAYTLYDAAEYVKKEKHFVNGRISS